MRTSFRTDVLILTFRHESAADSECPLSKLSELLVCVCVCACTCVCAAIKSALLTEGTLEIIIFSFFCSEITLLPFTHISLWYLLCSTLSNLKGSAILQPVTGGSSKASSIIPLFLFRHKAPPICALRSDTAHFYCAGKQASSKIC